MPEFEWDELKNLSNQQKHFIDFVEAKQVFQNEYISFEDVRQTYGEKRTITLGAITIDKKLVVVVVHTNRSGVIRIISARRANKKERKVYDDFIKKRTP